MRASALSPGHSRVLSGPGSGRIARRARRSVPLIRCMTVTDPSFSSPIGGHVDGEPFSLGLRRDADQALILGEPLGRGAMGVVRAVTRKSDGCTFALKTIPKAGPQSLAGQTPTGEAMTIWERKVRDEVSLHFALGASLDIVTLHDGFEDEAGVHLLIDLCDGGDLLSGASVAHSTEDEDNAVVPKNDDDDEEFSPILQFIQRRRRELRGRMLDPFLGSDRRADDPRHAPRARRVPRARRRAPRRQTRQLSLHARTRRSQPAETLRLW